MTDSTAAARYRAARRAQNELQIRDTADRVDTETPEYLDTNDETAAAARDLPGWRVMVIDWQVAREQDFGARLAAAAHLARAARRAERAGSAWDRAANRALAVYATAADRYLRRGAR